MFTYLPSWLERLVYRPVLVIGFQRPVKRRTGSPQTQYLSDEAPTWVIAIEPVGHFWDILNAILGHK